MSGWSLYLDSGRPAFVYNCFGHEVTTLMNDRVLEAGRHEVAATFDYDGGFGAGGELVLSIDGDAVAHARIERTVPLVFSMSGETFDVGIDTGSPVGNYPHGFTFNAEIHGVTLERLSEPGDAVAAAMKAGLLQAGLRTQ